MDVTKHRQRVKHVDLTEDAHFLTFSYYGRRQLISKNRTWSWFFKALNKTRVKHQFDLCHVYCLHASSSVRIFAHGLNVPLVAN